MEPPRRAVIVERVLAALALAAALGTAWAENGSELAAHIRDARPWSAWMEARQTGLACVPSFHLAVYDPARRHLSVLHIPGSPQAAQEQAMRLLAELSPASPPSTSTRLQVMTPPLSAQDEPAVEASRALKARTRSPRAWLSLLRGALDPLILAVELRRVPVERLQPAILPEGPAAVDLLGRILSGEERPPDGKATTVETLNGTDEDGLASRASKMLRLRGIDVMAMGKTQTRARTLVYDRVGDFRRAAEVRAALSCPAARIATRLNPSRAVDVSVELGADCKEIIAWNSSKY
ncbi:MAG: LytR C-terminal domain-containing protein [Elusimicrobiota bacterium]